MKQRSGSDQEGAVAVLVALLIVALLAFAAIVVDAGAVFAQRRQMQTAADSAALAGVQELPGNPAAAMNVADSYAVSNIDAADDRTFRIESTYAANDTLVAELRQSAMGLFFARVMGHDDAPVAATATAIIGSPTTYGSGLMPFGIIANGTTAAPYGYNAGEWIELVVDNGKDEQGNWHYVDLTPFTGGASQTKAVISRGGTTDPVSIGTSIYTQTGSPTNPNFGALNDRFTCAPHGLEALVYDEGRDIYEPTHSSDGSPCNRLITCPVIVISQGDPYDWDSVTGKTATRVVGFLNMLVSNDPEWKEGTLIAKFVQVVPANALNPGAYVPYAGVVMWLER
ncbi:MAG: Tad domain-containing protein [Coriobacteriia bacterium]|nr:Tad domain-containing protein [Coriobacteriia bacterium]